MSELQKNLSMEEMFDNAEKNGDYKILEDHLEEIKNRLKPENVNQLSPAQFRSIYEFANLLQKRKGEFDKIKGNEQEKTQVALKNLKEEIELHNKIKEELERLKKENLEVKLNDYGIYNNPENLEEKVYVYFYINKIGDNYIITANGDNVSLSKQLGTLNEIEKYIQEIKRTPYKKLVDQTSKDKEAIDYTKKRLEENNKSKVEKKKKVEVSKNFNEEKNKVANLLGLKSLDEINLISALKTINSVNGNIGNESDNWEKAGYKFESSWFKGSETEQLNELLKASKNEKYADIFHGISFFISQGKTVNDYLINFDQVQKLNNDNVFIYLSDRFYNNPNLISNNKDYKANNSDGFLTEAFLLTIFKNKKNCNINNIIEIIKRGGYKGNLGNISNINEFVLILKKDPIIKEYFLRGADRLQRHIVAFMRDGIEGYEKNLEDEKKSFEKLGLNNIIGPKLDEYISSKENDPKISNELKQYLSYLKENKSSIIDRLKIDFIGAYASFLKNRTGGGIGASLGIDSENEFLKNFKLDFGVSNINGVFLPTIGAHYSKEIPLNGKKDTLLNTTIGTILIFPYGTLGIRKITNINEFENIGNPPGYTNSIIAGLYAGMGKNFSLVGAGVYIGKSKDYKESIAIGEEKLAEGITKLLNGIQKVDDLDKRKSEIISKIDSEKLNENEKKELKEITSKNLDKLILDIKPQLISSGFDNSNNKNAIIENIIDSAKLKFREISGMVANQEQEAYRILGFIPTFGYRFSGWVIGVNILGALTGSGLPIFGGIEGQKIKLEYKESTKDRFIAAIKDSDKINLTGTNQEVAQKLSKQIGKKVEFKDGFIIIEGIDDLVLHIEKGSNVKISGNNLIIGDLGEKGIFYNELSLMSGKEEKNLFIGKNKQIPESSKEELKSFVSAEVKPFVLEKQTNQNIDLTSDIPEDILKFIKNEGKKFHTLLQNGKTRTFTAFKNFTKNLDEGDFITAKIHLFKFLDNGFKQKEIEDIKITINNSNNLGGIFNKFKQYMATDSYSVEKIGLEGESKEEFEDRINKKREDTILYLKKYSKLKIKGDIIYLGNKSYNLRGSNLLGLRDYFSKNNNHNLAIKTKMLHDLNMTNEDLYTKVYSGAGNSRKDAFENFLTKTGIDNNTQKQISIGYEKLQNKDVGWLSTKIEKNTNEPIAKSDNTFALMWDSKIATGGGTRRSAGSYFTAMAPGYVDFANGETVEINPSESLITLLESKKEYYKNMFESFQKYFESQGTKLTNNDFKKLLLNGNTIIDGKNIKLSRKFITFGYGECNNPSVGLTLGTITIGENKPLSLSFSGTGSVITNEPIISDSKIGAGAAVSVGEKNGNGGNKGQTSTPGVEGETDTGGGGGGNPGTETGGR